MPFSRRAPSGSNTAYPAAANTRSPMGSRIHGMPGERGTTDAAGAARAGEELNPVEVRDPGTVLVWVVCEVTVSEPRSKICRPGPPRPL